MKIIARYMVDGRFGTVSISCWKLPFGKLLCDDKVLDLIEMIMRGDVKNIKIRD